MASVTSGSEVVIVPPSFTSNNPADCILKSSDGAEFYVLRGILIFASDMFKDMFSLPATSKDTEPGHLPTIQMAESGPVLSALLSIIYPIVPPQISDVSLAAELCRAWRKYLMPEARLQPFLAEFFSESSLLQRPLDIYALAWRLDNKAEAKRASRYTHGVEMSTEAVTRLLVVAGYPASLSSLITLRESRQSWLKAIAIMVPIREFACPNHGGGDNGVYDKTAYYSHLLAMEDQIKTALSEPNLGVCHDFRDFLGLRTEDKRWPGPRLAKRCSHPTNNYCFGNMEPHEIRETSALIESLRSDLPMEIMW
ncbi:hypothetical protein FRC04_008187 [Tulasnella sp. 424]|nr:hypothetical protein FRC04_008187 [Tulasnella sp. 424]KAG8974470.1 hypothetical protein FRC05_007269 [Tulasnella sp. 425]